MNNCGSQLPDLTRFFKNPSDNRQREKLVRSLALIVHWLDVPEQLSAYAEQLARKHAELGMLPDDYEPIGRTLLKVLAEGLGPKVWNSEIETAWSEAVERVTELLIANAKALENGDLGEASSREWCTRADGSRHTRGNGRHQ